MKMNQGERINVTQIRALGCPRCSATMRVDVLRFVHDGYHFGYFPAVTCPNGHKYFDAEACRYIERHARRMGIWDDIEQDARDVGLWE